MEFRAYVKMKKKTATFKKGEIYKYDFRSTSLAAAKKWAKWKWSLPSKAVSVTVKNIK